MQIALRVEATDLRINNDSQIVVNQIIEVYQTKDRIMQKYLARVRALKAELGKQESLYNIKEYPEKRMKRQTCSANFLRKN